MLTPQDLRRLGGRCGGAAALMAALLGLCACGTTLQDQSGSAASAATAAAAPASPPPMPGATPAAPAQRNVATYDYVVKRGDTLSALSRRTGTSVAQLASLNALPPPYGINVGQTLRLPETGSAPPQAPAAGVTPPALPSLPGSRSSVLAAGQTAPVAAPRDAVAQAALPPPAAPPAALSPSEAPAKVAAKPEPVVASPPKSAAARPVEAAPSEPYVVPSLTGAAAGPPSVPLHSTADKAAARPGEQLPTPSPPRTETRPEAAQTVAAQAASAASPLPKPPARSGSGFLMPVSGRIIAGFGPQRGGLHNDGVNIAAAKGTPVKAADTGVVVYAGNELRGFGNMLLLQHEGGWMTAYAHLDSMAAARGQRVTRGQKIGAVGMTGNVTAPQLHFEIRQGKQPVDPEKQIAAGGQRTAMIGQLR